MSNREQIIKNIQFQKNTDEFVKSLEEYGYLDKEITKKCIKEKKWDYLKTWVSYNLKKQNNRRKQ